MKHVLDDGRVLVAAYTDLQSFFEKNRIVGRVISDIRAAASDYMICNLDDIEIYSMGRVECAINTDSQVCIIFQDGNSMEIEFSGDGPIVLGFNTADFSKYPVADGTCYSLRTMFQYCIGYEITNVAFDKSDKRMRFPLYRGIDMSEDDDGVKEIRIQLRGGTTLVASGNDDFFEFRHTMDFGGLVTVPLAKLINELNNETRRAIVNEEKQDDDFTLESFSTSEIETSDYDDDVLGNFGFKDEDGNIVIEPQYASCGEFHCGLCPVAMQTWYKTPEGKRYYLLHWGYIDRYGKSVIPFKFREAWSFNKYGVAVVRDEYGSDYYMIDTTGATLPDTTFIEISHFYEYETRYFEFSNVDTGEDNNMGLYDTKERRIIVPPITQGTWEVSEDIIRIEETGPLGFADYRQHYINSKGEELYPQLTNKGFGTVDLPNEDGYSIISIFRWIELTENATQWTPMNGKKYRRYQLYGVVDLQGNILIPPQYEEIKYSGNGVFECQMKKGSGCISYERLKKKDNENNT